MLFNLTPSLTGTGGMDNQNLIGTNVTGTSNATQLILAGGIDSRFDSLNLDGDPVVSSLTGPINNTPPPQTRQLYAFSNENEEDDKMEQEEQQEEEDNIELDKTIRGIKQIPLQLWQPGIAQISMKESIAGIMEIMTIWRKAAKRTK